jgi:lipoyl(octanoyl) transferase
MSCASEKTRTCLQIIDCGLADYREILRRQHDLHKQLCDGSLPNIVLIAEHYPVITFGIRQSANRLRINQNSLAQQNIDVVRTRRGGGVTAHNPGQLVFYPILDLRRLGLGISEYIGRLETLGIELLRRLGLKSQRRKGLPGLWIADSRRTRIEIRNLSRHGHKHSKRPEHLRFARTLWTGWRPDDIRA